MKKLVAGLALVPALLLSVSACGDEVAGAASGDDRPTPATYEHPTGRDEVVLRVTTAGGYTSLEYQFSIRPTIAVFGDGRVLLPDLGDDELGRTRMVPLRQVDVTEEQLQELLRLADDAGLLAEPPSYDMGGNTMVTDNPTTTVVVDAEGAVRRHAAYALDFDLGDTPARVGLRRFVRSATAMFADAPGTPYEPEQVQLYVTGEPEGADIDVPVIDWPADGPDLGGPDGCRVVDAGSLVPLLSGADAGAWFRQGDALYSVTGAEVLPGEVPCQDW